MTFMNYTPHTIYLNDGRAFEPCGTIARVSASFTEAKDDVCEQTFDELIDLPAPAAGVCYIVSAMVLAAAKAQGRTNYVAPATGHPLCVRDNGRIVSVPCFVK